MSPDWRPLGNARRDSPPAVHAAPFVEMETLLAEDAHPFGVEADGCRHTEFQSLSTTASKLTCGTKALTMQSIASPL